MKHAVITSGGKQYLVAKDDEILVEKMAEGSKKIDFEPLMVFDEKDSKVGTPAVKGAKVSAEILDSEVKGDKIVIRKFKPKKRINTVQGHRQKYTKLKITSIST